MSPSLLALSYFFHLIATIIWVGGLVLLATLVWPEARRTLENHATLCTLLSHLRRRFAPLSNFSLVVLLITGLIQMSGDPNYDGMLQFSNEWSRVILLKHVAVGGMMICGLALQYWVYPALERAGLLIERGKDDAATWAKWRRQEVRLTWVSVGLGLAVLGFTAWATAL